MQGGATLQGGCLRSAVGPRSSGIVQQHSSELLWIRSQLLEPLLATLLYGLLADEVQGSLAYDVSSWSLKRGPRDPLVLFVPYNAYIRDAAKGPG